MNSILPHSISGSASRNSAILVLTCLLIGPAQAKETAHDDVLGYWAGESSILHVEKHDGALTATIIALMDPRYGEHEETGTPGMLRKDDNHPEASLRQRNLLGLNLLSQYRHSGKRWEGKIYDPESGNTYSSRMEVDRQGNLKMRGYIGIPMMGRTAVFEPLKNCTANMQTMLAKSRHNSGLCKIK